MANTGLVDQTRLYNFAGMDDIVANERVRATPISTTITGAAALGTGYTTTVYGSNWLSGFGPPRTGSITTATQNVAFGDLATGIITILAQSAVTLSFDTAANLVAGLNGVSAGAVIGDVIPCLIINGGSGSVITLAASSGGGFDTNNSTRTILSGSSKQTYTRFTNVTSGSEAYVIYF